MRTRLALVLAVTALFAVGAASAAAGNGKIHYAFLGQLTAAPADGQIAVTIVGGNKPALRAMLGQSAAQTFSYGDSTEFLRWQAGVPSIVTADNLAVGDYVRINLRAARGSSLSDLEGLDSPLVGDHGTELYKPTQPLYLFRGKLTSVGDSSVTLDVAGGNSHALRLLIGQSKSQSFTTGDATIVLLWQGKVPTVISPSQLKVGDRVAVRIRADKGSSLSTVESTAAVHVGDREPANASS